MAKAFVFPGQGSQAVGMGKALADTFSVARETFAEVDAKKFEEALGSIKQALGVTPSAQGILEKSAMRQAQLSEDGQEVFNGVEAVRTGQVGARVDEVDGEMHRVVAVVGEVHAEAMIPR